jgi:hypothetical protein
MNKLIVTSIFAILILSDLFAQEAVSPLQFQSFSNENIGKKIRGIGLPFFEDFSQFKNHYPNSAFWQDSFVYINNTFAIEAPSAGVATFDGLNQYGQVYHPSGFPVKFSADSLTSVGIDLSTYNAVDSIYLSFFYQAEGLGFKPEATDSLILYFLGNNNSWVRIWAKEGSTVQPFEQIFVPITSSFFLHNNFQFRFINTASPNINDDTWHLDYIRIDKNRSINDKNLKDVALVKTPNSLLTNYTSKPIKHINAGDIETFCGTSLQNNSTSTRDIMVKFKATNITTNTILKEDSVAINITPFSLINVIIPSYNTSFTGTTNQFIEHKFYFADTSIGGRTINDTINGYTHFENYFAYDDGSAEKAYYLFGLQGTPMSTALKFNLSVADSVQGLAIKFGAQAPVASGKPFTITLYKKLDTITALQEVIYSQNFYNVTYENSINQFSFFKFDTAQHLQPGTYYIGTTQQPFSGSDTIYFGLDANTSSNVNNLFFNIDSRWQKSTLAGSIMLRPLVGTSNSFYPTYVDDNSMEPLNIFQHLIQYLILVVN